MMARKSILILAAALAHIPALGQDYPDISQLAPVVGPDGRTYREAGPLSPIEPGTPVAASKYWKWTPQAEHHKSLVTINSGNNRTVGTYVKIGGNYGIISCLHGKPASCKITFSDGTTETGTGHPDRHGFDLWWYPLEEPRRALNPITVANEAEAPPAGASVEAVGRGGGPAGLRHFWLEATGRKIRGRQSAYRGAVIGGDSGGMVIYKGKLAGVISTGGEPIGYVGPERTPVLDTVGVVSTDALAAFAQRISGGTVQFCGPGNPYCSPQPVAPGGGSWDGAYPPGRVPPGPPDPDPPTVTPPAPTQVCPCELEIGTVETVDPGEPASATLADMGGGKYALNLKIPRGAAGLNGEDGDDGNDGNQGPPGTVDEEKLLEKVLRLVKDQQEPLSFKARALVPVRDAQHRAELAKLKGISFEVRDGKTYAVLGDPVDVRVDGKGGGMLNIIHAFDVRAR